MSIRDPRMQQVGIDKTQIKQITNEAANNAISGVALAAKIIGTFRRTLIDEGISENMADVMTQEVSSSIIQALKDGITRGMSQ